MTLAKQGKLYYQSSEAKLQHRDSNSGPPGRQSNTLTHSANDLTHCLHDTVGRGGSEVRSNGRGFESH